MRTTIARWGVLAISALIAAPLLAALFNRLSLAGDGGPASTILVSVYPAKAAFAVLLAYGVALLLGCLGATLSGPRAGLAAAAFTIMGPAWASGTMIDLLRWADAPRSLYLLAAEGLVLGLLTFALAAVISRLGKASERDSSDPLLSPASGLGILAAVIACAAGVWLITQDTTKGQTIGGAVMGGLFAACAGRIASPRASALAFILVVVALGALAPIAGAVMHGGESLRAIYETKFVHMALPLPLDWAAGALLGVPLGLNLLDRSWSASRTAPARRPRRKHARHRIEGESSGPRRTNAHSEQSA